MENNTNQKQEIENSKMLIMLKQKVILISILLIVLGFFWVGVSIWKIIIENDIYLGGKKRVSDTFYWGENHEIEVQWKWLRTGVKNQEEIITIEENKILNRTTETHKKVDQRLCFISGVIKNKSDKKLQIHSITMILQPTDQINLYEISNSLDLMIDPNMQKEFEINEYIETSYLSNFNKMSALLSFDFIEEK